MAVDGDKGGFVFVYVTHGERTQGMWSKQYQTQTPKLTGSGMSHRDKQTEEVGVFLKEGLSGREHDGWERVPGQGLAKHG